MSQASMSTFVRALLRVCEKAARIARACREETELFSMLVEEKGEKEKNPKASRDFKTLADVLVQEVVRRDLERQFPDLRGHIFGEESNKLTNSLGECVIIEVKRDATETAELLAKVMGGNATAAGKLASHVHAEDVTPTLDDEERNRLHSLETGSCPKLSVEQLGIWIDPIDSTSEYICGRESDDALASGIHCVTVLVGAFDRDSGLPVVGVVNQPFREKTTGASSAKWSGRHFWGVCYNGYSLSSFVPPVDKFMKKIVISPSEVHTIGKDMSTAGITAIPIAGAGYKLNCVATGLCDAAIMTRGVTFRWDTCAGHAVLKSLGGGVVNLTGIVDSDFGRNGSEYEIKYNKGNESGGEREIDQWCNREGLIAFRSWDHLNVLVKMLRHSKST